MSLFTKGIILLVVHVLIVSALGVKLLYDRAILPRVWVRAVPFDPDLPVRGRYVSLRLIVETAAVKNETKEHRISRLYVHDGKLFAGPAPGKPYRSEELSVRQIYVDGREKRVLDKPVAFFIPEHIPDPSVRAPGEELWVEVTIPKKGIPRPIRMGVKRVKNSHVQPLDIR